jgi:hypothetical protein
MRENTFYFPPPFFFGTEFTNIAFLILNFGYDRDSKNGNFSFSLVGERLSAPHFTLISSKLQVYAHMFNLHDRSLAGMGID